MFQKNIMAPQIVDQSEGVTVCGIDWTDQLNSDKRIVGLIKPISNSRSLHRCKLKLCRDHWQLAPKLTCDVGEKGFPYCLTNTVKLS